jgi:UDP-N-acetylmuramoyl-tripeptide--D-alanyl-D-alanine ligase
VIVRRPGILQLLRSSAGRMEIQRRYMNRMLPVLTPFARVYRGTLLRRVRVVVVIGSVGKTTTMRAISAALGVRVRRQALLNANSATPTARALLTTVRPWQERVVFELAIGSYGEMGRMAKITRPDIVVVTAIARDHWKTFGTLEATRNEKAVILRGLSPNGIAVMNADDENVRWMATQTRARVVFIGEAADAEIRATDIELDWPHGMRFTAHVGGEQRTVKTNLLGRHMVFPALSAIAVAHLEGVPLDDAVAALADLKPTPGRMQMTPLPNGATVIRDEFKGSTDPMEAALRTLAEVPARQRIAVFGELAEARGNDDYREMGRRIGTVADRAIFIGKTKNAKLLRTGASTAGMSHDRVQFADHAWEATQLLRGTLQEGDVVLTSGRWQQALGRIGLELAGRDVKCHADPCPFKRMLCDVCPFLEKEFRGLGSLVPDD